MNIIPFNPPQMKIRIFGCLSKSCSALSRPTLGHLDPLFIKMMDETKYLMQSAFQTIYSAYFCTWFCKKIAFLLERGTRQLFVNGVFGIMTAK